MYDAMAAVYDELMYDVDYEGWFNYIERSLIDMVKGLNPY